MNRREAISLVGAAAAWPLAVHAQQANRPIIGYFSGRETLPGFEAVGWQVLVAPAGTPDTILQKANADLTKAIDDPETRNRLARQGREDRAMSPAETLAFIQGEQAKWAPIQQQIARAR